ncbi:hypothetical protein [Magnetovibrio blakemorei]|uniref:Uncharacterized protein n=1 Tax=Magnetovibrio blakemorei TaxID=28181 RepID=A0A1E5Q5T7_9PROT|nr:hypothetical protein [Magnetovibrio blakemorei]OEJ65966.1 hypothetical protein BEN30_13285 [Magnetovibrio blakemorei]
MGVDPDEMSEIQNSLSSPQGASREEVAAFKKVLSHTSTEVILKRLDDNVIARAWKRDLAEAEVDRRESAAIPGSKKSTSDGSQRHKSAVLKSWGISFLLIIVALALVAVKLL